MVEKDFYNVLSVSEYASQEEVRASYRKLALQYHPDRNKDNPQATEKMKEINEAYAILSDSVKRQEYDQLRLEDRQAASERYRQAHTTEDIFRGSDINQVFSDMAREFGLRNFDKVFRDAYGQRYRSFEFRNKGMYGRAFIFYGTARRAQPIKSGEITQRPEAGPELTRIVRQMASGSLIPQRGKDRKNKISLSPKLADKGGEVDLHINQSGMVRNLRVTIPLGIKHGQQIRLRGLGGPGKGGGQAGDLFLQVSIQTSLWERILRFFKK